MVLLHISLDATATSTNKVKVSLPHEIQNQTLTLKKSIVFQKHANGGGNHSVIYLKLGKIISNYEITSNSSENYLPISMDPDVNRTESDYHISFHAEKIPREFYIEVFSDVNGTALDFETDANHKLQHISLLFEYQSNHQI